MKILFTGGAGYIGSHVLHFFIKKGVKPQNIIVVDNLSSGKRKNVPSGCIFYKIDITDKKRLEMVFKKHKDIDFVFHFAGLIHVEESMKNPQKYFLVNSFGGLNILDLMSKYKISKIIFSSTASVYGNPEYTPIDENHLISPINPYAESKFLFEEILKWFEKIYGIKYIIFRYFNACGVEKTLGNFYHEPCGHVIPKIVLNFLGEEKEFHLFGTNYQTKDGTCVRDYIDIRDLASAHYLGYKYLNNKYKNEILNLGTGKGTTVKEIIGLAEKISGRKLNLKIKSRRLGDPAKLICDNKKAKKVLGWSPKINLEHSIRSHWQWFKDKYE